jgi:exosortase
VAAFAPTFAWLWHRWTRSVWSNAHGMFMPIILAWLVRDKLRAEEAPEPESSAWGFAFLIPGLSMLALDSAIRTELMAATGLVVCLPGLSLLFLGARRTRALIFPLMLAPLMLPIPAAALAPISLTLREVSAWGAAQFVALAGIPVIREGTDLLIPRGPIYVTDACSGTQTLLAAVTLSFILAYFTPSTLRRVVLLVGAWILAVVCNMLRVASLVMLVHYWGYPLLQTKLHETSGMLSFSLALIALFLLADWDVLRGRKT